MMSLAGFQPGFQPASSALLGYLAKPIQAGLKPAHHVVVAPPTTS